MNTDLEPYQGGTTEPYERLTHDEMVKVGQALHQSGWFKDITDPGKAVVKIMLGQEMGVSPMTAVRGIFVIPSSRGPVITLSGDLVAKLMKAHGYTWNIDALDEQGCRLTIFSGPRKLGQVEFTQTMARKAGLLGKDGPWKQFTEDMFFNRAICRAQRRYAPEVTGGLPMPVVEAEELDDSYPDPRDDLVKALHATYREVYPKEADENPENYRGRRLMWSEQVLSQGQTQWRVIPSWNGPQAPETLTRADVQTLLDALESTLALTREQAAPSSSPDAASAAGADSTAPQGSAGEADSLVHVAQPGPAPAEHHPQGSAGWSESESPDALVAQGRHAPAEHHTDEAKGSAPADGTVPAGESRSDTGPSVGPVPIPDQWTRERRQHLISERLTESWLEAAEKACRAEHEADPFPCEWHIQSADQAMKDANKPAPAKSAPTRKRRPTDPTGAPKVAEAIKEAQQFRDNRKTQTEVERIPADPIQAMPPTFRELFLKHFGNELEPALSAVNAHIIEWGPKYPATGDAAPWNLELLQELAADTFEKDMYR